MKQPANLPHLATRVFGTPLLIQPEKLTVILDVLGRRIGMGEHVLVEGLPVAVTRPSPDDEDGDEAQSLLSSGRKPYPVSPDGIAVIGISGTLVKKASWLDAESGLQSYQDLRMMIADAREDPGIRGLLLDVDSPGGEVGGLFDLADEVFAVRDQKPCYAIANDEAFSAAYALASSAQRLFVTRTGGVGSIGVIAVHLDQSGFDEKVGRKYTAVFAGARKNDFSTHQPLSDDAREGLQAEIDRLYGMFVAAVERNRGMPAALVRKTEAGIYWGQTAIGAGLADQVGTFDDALAAVTDAARSFRKARVTASAETQIQQGEESMSQSVTKPADVQPEPAAAVEPKPDAPAAVAAPVAVPPQPPQEASPETVAAIEARLLTVQEAKVALCKTAGRLDLLPEMLSPSLSISDVSERLLAVGAQRSQATAVQSHVQGAPVGAESQLNAAATNLAASKGISFAKAYMEALKANPALYQQYLAEKAAAVRAA